MQLVDLTQHLIVVGGTHVSADLAAGKILGVHRDNDFNLVGQFSQHPHLVVGRETGQDTRSVHVVDQFSAELQIQLSAELAATAGNVSRLHLDVTITVKTDAVHASSEVANMRRAAHRGRSGAFAPSEFHCRYTGRGRMLRLAKAA